MVNSGSNNGKSTEGSKSHLVKLLEDRLGQCVVQPSLTNDLKVVAYHGYLNADGSKCDINDKPNTANIRGKDIQVIWRDTAVFSDETKIGDHCSHCPHQQPDGQNTLGILPFWRGCGDDLRIQQMIQHCCGNKLSPDFLGRISFNSFRAVIFMHGDNHSFMLAPVIPHEGDELGKRIRMTTQLIEFLARCGLNPVRICVLKGSRQNWQKYSGSADGLSRQAEILISNVKSKIEDKSSASGQGIVLEFMAEGDLDFEIENAIQLADLIIPYDGSTGNLLARLLTYSSTKISLWAIPWFIKDKPWPVGEGAFVGYQWKNPTEQIERAAMWKIQEECDDKSWQ
jgi:hypothetical protein